VVANVARSLGALTIGVVTRPFGFEGKRRVVQAEIGIEKLRSEVDTLIVIPNDRLLSISDRHVSVLDAFKAADQVLLSGVQGITDLITTPGLINLDFADVKSVMSGAGSALMGTGSSRGDDRAVAAAEMAISSPLLEASIDGAHGVLLSIQGGSDLGLFEINEAAQLVSNSAAVDANIIFGAVIDDALGDEVRVTVIAAGLDQERAGRGSADAGGSSFSVSASASPAPAPSPTSSVFTPPRPASSALARPVTPEAGDNVPPAVGHGSNGSTPAVPDARITSAAGSTLSAPVPGDGFTASSDLAAEVTTPAYEMPETEPARPESSKSPGQPERVAVTSDAGDSASYRPAHAEAAGKTFDVATTRRRPVVFEEDDDLDVPDFLK
jgi:cell division protein FtsZ